MCVGALMLGLIKSYLENRRQILCWGGENSSPLIARHGVFQGSVLGLLFFIIIAVVRQSYILTL